MHEVSCAQISFVFSPFQLKENLEIKIILTLSIDLSCTVCDFLALNEFIGYNSSRSFINTLYILYLILKINAEIRWVSFILDR